METTFSPCITVTNLTKKYRSTIAIKNLDLSIPVFSVTGIIGPSGAGKTTLMKLFSHLVVRYKGTLKVFNTKPNESIKSMISLCPEISACDAITTADDIISQWDYLYKDFDMLKAHRLLQEQHINPFIPIQSLSLSIQRKVSLSLALCRKVPLYLLDDPFKAMNDIEQANTLAFLKQHLPPFTTIIIASEFVQHIEKILDVVIFLQEGCLMGVYTSDDITIPFKRLYDEVMVR